MTEDRINNPEDGLVEVTQSQHREKKRHPKKLIETQVPME